MKERKRRTHKALKTGPVPTAEEMERKRLRERAEEEVLAVEPPYDQWGTETIEDSDFGAYWSV